MDLQLEVLSIQVGLVRAIEIGGKTVKSAISKIPVTGCIKVTKLGLEGDEQADLSVHGGLYRFYTGFQFFRKRVTG